VGVLVSGKEEKSEKRKRKKKKRKIGREDTHLPANSPMSAAVRAPLKARPKLGKRLFLLAPVDVGLARHNAYQVVDVAVDAVRAEPVARTDVVDERGERPGGDAPVWSAAVTAKARDGVEHN